MHGLHLQASCLRFDTREESLWIGTESGTVAVYGTPGLDRLSAVPAHHSRVADMRSLGQGLVSISAGALRVEASGCAPRLTVFDEVGQGALRDVLEF